MVYWSTGYAAAMHTRRRLLRCLSQLLSAAAGPFYYFICIRSILGRYFIVYRTRFSLGISNFITPQDVSSVGRSAFCMHAQSIVDPQKYLNRNDDDDDIPSRAPKLGGARYNNCDDILNVFTI